MLLYEYYYNLIFFSSFFLFLFFLLCFFKCLKSPSSFNINNYVSFASSSQDLLQIPNFCTLTPPLILLGISILIVSPVFGTLSLFSPWKNRLNHLSKISRLFFGTISSPTLILILHAPFISLPCRSCTPLSLHHNFTQAV